MTYVSSKYAQQCEPLDDLDISSPNLEAQWIYVHRPNFKDSVICNIYRPPAGDLAKAISYLDNRLKSFNLSKIDLFLIVDFNVNYKNQRSPTYKKLHFFAQSNGLSQYINSTSRNTDKRKSLIDLALTNSKFISEAGTLNHFLSDHQPIFVVHKKGRDKRQPEAFSGRSYRNYDRKVFKERLEGINWGDYYQISDSDKAWEFMIDGITKVLDTICPVKTFFIKNYRPDWMSKELIEQIR